MPSLIDVHTHLSDGGQIRKMLKSGIVAACDVSASNELIEASKQPGIVSSAGMAMGIILSPKGFVEKAAAVGARYIKVLLYEKGLKVAVHATEAATVRQAVECGADILLHVPMKADFPEELAMTIDEKAVRLLHRCGVK